MTGDESDVSELESAALSRLRVALVDSGGANIGSVRYALDRLGVDSALTGDPATILAADRVILPGVGAADVAMAHLHELGLVALLRGLQTPLLGICLGMQLLFDSSEEVSAAAAAVPVTSDPATSGPVTSCLGLIPGRVRKLVPAPGARVPHIGWNRLQPVRSDPLTNGLGDAAQAYFVHSFAAPVTADTISTFTHGQPYAAVVGRGNVRGAQFHPERSSNAGARLLRNFLLEVPA